MIAGMAGQASDTFSEQTLIVYGVIVLICLAVLFFTRGGRK